MQLPIGPDALIEPERWAQLDAYFAEKLPLAERIEMERWAAESENREKLVAQLRAVWVRAANVAPEIAPVDIRQVLNALAEKRHAMDAMAARPSARVVELARFRQQASAVSRPRFMMARGRSGRPVTIVAAIAAALLLAVGLPFLSDRPSAPTVASSVSPMREIVTKRGQRAAVDLADGSRVVLAADSRLQIPADFDVPGANGTRRELYLIGKAYFEVEHDSARPFIVHTATATTEDIGTEFVVNAYPEAHATKVAVVSGLVAMWHPRTDSSLVGSGARGKTSAAPLMLLEAGDVARLDRSGTATVARDVPLASYVSWANGVLAFDGTPVRDALAELSRWYDVDFTIGNIALDELHITGEFRDEPIDQAVQRLELMLDARATRTGRSVILTRARTQRAAP